MRLPGFEPGLQAWEAWVLTSLDHSRTIAREGPLDFKWKRGIEGVDSIN